MAVVAFATGTQSTSVGTEHFVSSPNAAGTYQLVVDLNAMAAGDVVELRAYAMTLTGGTARVAFLDVLADAQPDDAKIAVSVPVATELAESNAIRFSVKQTRGSSRSLPWKVLQLDG